MPTPSPPTPDPDDREVCLCFHVPLGKLVRHMHRHRPRVPSQLADCHGAGTGCGWCIPFLERLFEQHARGEAPTLALSPDEYQARRADYRRRTARGPASTESPRPLRGDLDLDRLLEDIPDDLSLDPPDPPTRPS